MEHEELRIKEEDYFVAHDFHKEYKDKLRQAIEGAFGDAGLKPYYADIEIKEGHILRDKIFYKIRQTKFGIYEITDPPNPNVFLELGIAMGLGKPYYLICQEGITVPSDLHGLDRIQYSSFEQLTDLLKNKVKIKEIEGQYIRYQISKNKAEIMKLLRSGDITALNNRREKYPDEIIDLRAEDLSGLDLRDARLRDALLLGANLQKAFLKRADLGSCDLRLASLTGAYLVEANLSFALLQEANLQNADLRSADLYKADLSGSDLTGADLLGANLTEAKLISVKGWKSIKSFLGTNIYKVQGLSPDQSKRALDKGAVEVPPER